MIGTNAGNGNAHTRRRWERPGGGGVGSAVAATTAGPARWIAPASPGARARVRRRRRVGYLDLP
jgi:hypothetical protein